MKATTDDLLEALRQALPPESEDGKTGPELAEALDVSPSTIRTWIRKLMKKGKVDVVTLRRSTMTGQRTTVLGYRLK